MSLVTKPQIWAPVQATFTDGVANAVNDLADTYTQYTGIATALTAGAWVDLTWPTVAAGTGLGLSLASSTKWTLAAGLWTVIFSGVTGTAASTTGAIYGLFADNTHTSGTTYGESMAPLLVNQTAATVVAEILSTGSTTVVASVFAIGGSPSMSTIAGMPRITFSRKDTQ